jgi:hypothetical protein
VRVGVSERAADRRASECGNGALSHEVTQSASHSQLAIYLFLYLCSARAGRQPTHRANSVHALARSPSVLIASRVMQKGQINSDTFNSSAFPCARNWVTGNEICRSSSLLFKSIFFYDFKFFTHSIFTVFYNTVRLCKSKIFEKIAVAKNFHFFSPKIM